MFELLSYISYKINNLLVKDGYECIWCQHRYYKSKYKGFCSKRCWKKWQKERNQAFKHNARCNCHKLNRLSYRNQCWLCFKEDWDYQLTDSKIPFSWRVKLALNGFKKYKTYRTSTESWSRDKLVFEQSLLDNGIKWFAYIKLYVDASGKYSMPIVIGKSGSMKVNYNGSDLNFSTDPNDGNARVFLKKHRLTWNHDVIYIKKCRSEKKAYAVERTYSTKWQLYGS